MNHGYVCIDGQYYAPNHPFVKKHESASPFLNAVPVHPEPKKKRIRQSTKPLMNNLEQEWFDRLQRLGAHVQAQCMRFRLANGTWYKPDIIEFRTSGIVAWEVKGPHSFRGGMENLKIAASQYPEVTWHLIWKDNDQWQEQQVLP